MKQLIRCVVAVALAETVLIAAELRITVRVVNAEVIPDTVRLAGERLAADILKSAGVEIVWVECGRQEPNPCRRSIAPNEFWLHLLPGKAPRSLDGSAGFAVLYPAPAGRDGYAGVFYRQVLATAVSAECQPAAMLGATIAHEIGHLLLGSKTHSAEGVMRTRLGRVELEQALRGGLRFSAEQAASIRTRGCDNSPSACPIPRS